MVLTDVYIYGLYTHAQRNFDSLWLFFFFLMYAHNWWTKKKKENKQTGRSCESRTLIYIFISSQNCNCWIFWNFVRHSRKDERFSKCWWKKMKKINFFVCWFNDCNGRVLNYLCLCVFFFYFSLYLFFI